MTTRVSGLLPSCPLAAAVRSLQLSVRCCPVRRNGAVVINNKLARRVVRWKLLPSLWLQGLSFREGLCVPHTRPVVGTPASCTRSKVASSR